MIRHLPPDLVVISEMKQLTELTRFSQRPKPEILPERQQHNSKCHIGWWPCTWKITCYPKHSMCYFFIRAYWNNGAVVGRYFKILIISEDREICSTWFIVANRQKLTTAESWVVLPKIRGLCQSKMVANVHWNELNASKYFFQNEGK